MFWIDIMDLKITKNIQGGANHDFNQVMDRFLENGQIKITDEGHINICYSSFIYQHIFYETQQVIFFVSLIKRQSDTFNEYYFQETLPFHRKDVENFHNLTSRKIREQEHLLNLELTNQQGMPDKLKNDDNIRKIEKMIHNFKFMLRNAVGQELVHNKILLVYSPNFILYSFIGSSNLQQGKFKEKLEF